MLQIAWLGDSVWLIVDGFLETGLKERGRERGVWDEDARGGPFIADSEGAVNELADENFCVAVYC